MSVLTDELARGSLIADSAPASRAKHVFTVDVEDYFQVSGFEQQISREDWSSIESRVESSTHRILDLLDDTQTKGTFFVLGWVADEYPSLVSEIQRRGHEIGCHSYWHHLIYTQDREAFREDLIDARRAIEEACGVVVESFRAPSFSVIEESLWALEILVEEGFKYDSSINPIKHDRYGIPDHEPGIIVKNTPAGSITEFTPSISRLGRFNMPISGGGFFRLYPYALTKNRIRVSYDKIDKPYMFYIHPWEVDPDQPRVAGTSWKQNFRHRVNLRHTQNKLRNLLTDFEFGTMKEVIDAHALNAS